MAAQPTAAVVLGGGAPNSALMAGALAAIYDNNKTFNEFYTSGAGAVIGLVYLAARGLTPREALREVTRVGVDDAIYKWVPLGYKTFFKRGPWTVPFRQFGNRFKLKESFSDPNVRRLYNDWVDLVVAAVTPTSLTPSCDSLCAHYPFLHEAIDFAKLKQFKGKFFMNSYCIETGRPEQFDEDEIGPQHFYAALSYPFIYPPTRIGNRHYYEGAAHDPLNLPKFHQLCCKREIDFLVVIDVLGAFQKALIRRPTNLLDAYGISILMSVVAMAGKDMKRFVAFHKDLRHQNHKGHRHRHLYDLESLTFSVPVNDYPTICDWSYSNLERLWHIGYEGGSRFVEKFRDKLPDHMPDSADPVSPV
jgi:NTE family protein